MTDREVSSQAALNSAEAKIQATPADDRGV
jgi:hypothetical protein